MAKALFQKRAVAIAMRSGGTKTETLLWSCCSGWRRSCYMSHLAAAAPPPPQSSSFGIGSSSLCPPKLHQEVPRFFSFGGLMELMAVPKKKVSPYKRGLRNGPKALKPVPVIVRCKSCGRVKLPHFYCCSGERYSERNDSTS